MTGSAPPSAPGAAAGVAGDRGRHVDGLLDALEGLFQRDAQVVAQVRSALRPGPAAAAAAATAHEIAEQILEHVRKGAGEIALLAIAAAGRAAAAHATFKGGMTKAVIGGLLLVVLQDLIGLVHFLELGFGLRIVGVAVGVQLFRLGPIGLLQLFRRGALGRPRTS